MNSSSSPETHDDPAPRRRMLERVRDEVAENMADPGAVDLNAGEISGDIQE